MKRSRRGRSSARRRSRPGAGVDVYLFPAVIGGGLGDIEETLALGRRLERAGYSTWLYRRAGTPLPRDVDGPWGWPARLRRVGRLDPRAPAAMTVTPAWGVSAAPERPGPFGRAGPWAPEAADVERAYGASATVHVSLEEFARNLPTAGEDRERLREGGVPTRALPRRLRASRAEGDRVRLAEAYARYRAFDRPNLLHVFATFRPHPTFSAEFPAAVETGPLWPGRRRASPPRSNRRLSEWVWYASPASAERIAGEVIRGLGDARPPVRLFVRSPRPWTRYPAAPGVEVRNAPMTPGEWEARFSRAGLRIVTGSRTLLEAIEVGGPFLYFNGVLGRGPATRRHRPEKIAAWLAVERDRLPPDLRRDLSDFARGRRVREVVSRAARRADGWARFPVGRPASGFSPPFDDGGALVESVARALAHHPTGATEIVARVRAGSNP